MNHLHYLLAILFCLWNLACGTIPQGGTLIDKASMCRVEKSHPDRNYMVEFAEGSTVEEARDRASAALTRRLSAELRSEVSVKTAERSGVQVDDVQESVQVSSHFEHAELIKPIKRCESCIGKNCASAVFLQRDELAARLIKSISPELKRLTEALKDLKPESHLLRFTQAWYLSQASAKRVEPIIEQLKIIHRSSPELEGAEQGIEHARRERALREERLWIVVDHPEIDSQETLPESLREGLKGRISKGLETLGLKQSTARMCPSEHQDNTGDFIRIEPKGSLSCTLGLIGPQCRLKLSIRLSLCGAGELSEDSWSGLKLIGVHTRDQLGAINGLLKNLEESDLSSHLSKSLSPFIIL